MSMTETMIAGMVKSITGSYILEYRPDGVDQKEPLKIDFTPCGNFGCFEPFLADFSATVYTTAHTI